MPIAEFRTVFLFSVYVLDFGAFRFGKMSVLVTITLNRNAPKSRMFTKKRKAVLNST